MLPLRRGRRAVSRRRYAVGKAERGTAADSLREAGAAVAEHVITPGDGTLHGRFSRDLPPALTVDPGDTIVLSTLDALWSLEPPTEDGSPHRAYEPRRAGIDDGHALVGPVSVRGAEPGMTLEVELLSLRTGPWGWTRAGLRATPLAERLGVAGQPARLLWDLDRDAGLARDQFGHSVPLRPFLGVIGLAPAEPGLHPTWPPRREGGNIDCRELVAGSRLLLPIAVPGALLSVGDGHAAQGDGEVSGTAVECAMERVELVVRLHERLALETMRAETPAGTLTLGVHEDLEEAAHIALDAMVGLIAEREGISRSQALALASVVVDLRVTQIVNAGVRGVHALLPAGALARGSAG